MLDSLTWPLSQVNKRIWMAVSWIGFPLNDQIHWKAAINPHLGQDKQDFSTILSGEKGKHLSCSEQDLLYKHVTLSTPLTHTHLFWSLSPSAENHASLLIAGCLCSFVPDSAKRSYALSQSKSDPEQSDPTTKFVPLWVARWTGWRTEVPSNLNNLD